MEIVNICLYSLTLCFSIAVVIMSISIIFLMIIRWQFMRQDRVELLLMANTFMAGGEAVFFIGILSIFSIYGHVNEVFLFEGWFCLIIPFLLYIGGFTYFNSFALQAIYRYFRIAYRTNTKLQSFRFYQVCTVIIWLTSLGAMLTLLLCHQLEYIPYDYHCQVAPMNLQASLLLYSSGFIIPFSVTLFAYICAMRYIRKQASTLVTVNQNINNKRDIMVIKRLVIYLIIIGMNSSPHIVLPLIYLFSGFLPVWMIAAKWLLTSSCLLTILLFLLYTHPILKKLRSRSTSIRPNTIAAVTIQTT